MPGPVKKQESPENDFEIESQSSVTKDIKMNISGASRDMNGDAPSWDKSYQSQTNS